MVVVLPFVVAMAIVWPSIVVVASLFRPMSIIILSDVHPSVV
jgi:hypothetical protein